ncbi:MAG: ABC transporter ATP-binding protein [Acidobacteriota bacterium]
MRESSEEPTRDVPVVVANVRKRFGDTVALDGLSFDVTRGQMYGVIGPDGAGKTTLLRVICGLLTPDAGTVRVFGADPVRDHAGATHAIGYLSQRFSLYGDLSIDENIDFFARLHGVHDFEAKRTRLLELTGLARFRDRLADRLSGGMKQKLALACTLIHEPPLLILDEPTTGVDPVSRREFWKLLAEFLSQGLTIVVATPYLDEAERCSRVALINEGRVLAFDTPQALQAALPGVTFEVVTAFPRKAIDALVARWGADRVQLFGDRLHVRAESDSDADLLRSALAREGHDAVSVRRVMPGLEDVFIDLLAADHRRVTERAS